MTNQAPEDLGLIQFHVPPDAMVSLSCFVARRQPMGGWVARRVRRNGDLEKAFPTLLRVPPADFSRWLTFVGVDPMSQAEMRSAWQADVAGGTR